MVLEIGYFGRADLSTAEMREGEATAKGSRRVGKSRKSAARGARRQGFRVARHVVT
jgi:hypothetical protein